MYDNAALAVTETGVVTMFADPQTLTVNSVAKTLAAISRQGTASIYQTADGVYRFRVSHDIQAKKERHLVEVIRREIAADPYSEVQLDAQLKVQLVIENPTRSLISDTEITYVINAFCTWLTASSSAAVTKILGNES